VNSKLTTFSNGMRVISDPMSTVETVSVGAWIDVGTRDEHPLINGVSHVLEHMAFKGTKRRSAYAISEEIEAVGGQINAYTSREHTAYFAKVLKDDVELAVDLIADIIQHSTLDPEELERERAVIIQEIHQANDTPDDIIFDYFQETAFPDQAMGRPILGLENLVQNMKRESIIDYMRHNYSPPRIVVAASGNVDHDKFVKQVEKTFDSLSSHQPHDRIHPNYSGGNFVQKRDIEQVHFLLGFNGISYLDPDFYGASILSTLFGGGMSSRLFQEIREKRGLVYSIYSFVSSYSDSGLSGIYAATGKEEAPKMVPLILDEIAKVCESMSEKEIARAKIQLKASILMSQESTSSRCEQIARHVMVFGKDIPISETIEKIESVDNQMLLNTAQRLFSGPPTIATIGPVANDDAFQQISDRFK